MFAKTDAPEPVAVLDPVPPFRIGSIPETPLPRATVGKSLETSARKEGAPAPETGPTNAKLCEVLPVPVPPLLIGNVPVTPEPNGICGISDVCKVKIPF